MLDSGIPYRGIGSFSKKISRLFRGAWLRAGCDCPTVPEELDVLETDTRFPQFLPWVINNSRRLFLVGFDPTLDFIPGAEFSGK